MIEAVLAVAFGVLIGVLTGILPGIHPNTVLFSFLPLYFIYQPDFISFMAFISGLSVSHTLHDFLPALFLKSPEAESALSSLPGIEMVNEGLGRKAFILTLIGGLSSTIIFIILLPVLFIVLSTLYPFLEPVMALILVFFLLFIVLESKSRPYAVLIVILSGYLGLLVLNAGIKQQFILMPVFAGLFAAPAVTYSMSTGFEIPDQNSSFGISIERLSDGGAGFLSGLLAGLIPGIGAAVSTTFLTPLMEDNRESFLTGLGGVNTSDMLVSFLALYLIGRPRSGSSLVLQMISEVRTAEIFFLIGCSILASGLAGFTALKVLDPFIKIVKSFEFRFIGILIILLLLVTVTATTQFYGLLVFFTSAFIGFIALLTECRAGCMAVLIVPALTFFSGSFI
jgi:putative membrane protein